MKYLLDTNVIVDHLRGKQGIEVKFIHQGSAISVITQAELYYGAYKSKSPQENLAKIKLMLQDLAIEVIGFNESLINIYAKLKTDLEKKGEKLDEFDLLIATSALEADLVFITRNKKHFQRIKKLKLV